MSVLKDIKNLRIQGATEIAIRSLKYLKKFIGKKDFNKKCKQLLNARPTAVTLYNVLQELKKEPTKEKIDELLKALEESNKKIAKTGSPLIKNGKRVQTHCHSSSALAIIKEAAKNKKFTVIVDETRPKRQGIKTAKELSKIKNIEVILLVDSAAGLALSPPVIPMSDIVIVGTDAIRKEGVINKTGTYLLALAAAENGIPFYVAASRFKFDKRKKIKIEERPTKEVYRKIKNVKIMNPAFDITPWKYITGVVTENGIKKPLEIMKELRG
ncbi:MAG: translation initiation factor eIF-2B [Candidatus Aenigmarchaeota archaeon]|nr:translation initiation factor eIF-2B [Candidatus Aenigmarchaeota archaeon]